MAARAVYVTGQVGSREDRLAPAPDKGLRLYVNLSVPSLMEVAFIMLHGGSEEIVVHANERAELAEVLAELRGHPRLRRWEITDPTGKVVEEYKRPGWT